MTDKISENVSGGKSDELDFIDSVKEIEMNFRDHRADDDFERMLAELNGKKTKAEEQIEQPEMSDNLVEQDKSDKSESSEAHESSDEQKPKKAAESRPAAPAMSSAVISAGAAIPAVKPAQKKSRKPKPQAAKKQPAPELTEEEKAKLAAEAEKARREEIERAQEERKQRMIESIVEIWQSPDLSEGGRIKMNIKTGERREIHISLPPEQEQRVKARRDAELAEAARADFRRRNTEEEARIAAALAAIEKLEEPEIPPELKKHKPAAVKKDPNGEAQKRRTGRASPAAAGKVSESTIVAGDLVGSAVKSSVKGAAAAKGSATAAAAGAAVASLEKGGKAVKHTAKSSADAGRKLAETAKPHGQHEKSRQDQTAGRSAAGEAKSAAKTVKKENADNEKKARIEQIGKRFAVANLTVCCTIIFGLGVYLAVCERESGFISSENRNLAEKPKLTVESVLDGSYFEDITKWYTDTIPGREKLKPFSSGFEKLFGVTFNNVKLTGDIAPVKKETLEPSAATTTTVSLNTDFSNRSTSSATSKKKKKTSKKLAEVPEELDEGEWMGSVVVTGKGKNVRAMGAFYGQFDMGTKYAETVSRYREELGSSVNIYTLNMPTSAAYYMPENLADDFTSQADCIKNIGMGLSGVMNIDVYDALDAHKEEYIYSRTDHHWTPLGAYYAARVFSQSASFEFPELSTYEEYRIENFVGTMYAYSNYDEEIAKNPDTFIYYKPDNIQNCSVTNYDRSFSNGAASSLFFDFASDVNCYSAILGTDDQITEIETDCATGRTLVVIKDSFGNAMIPYLTHGFDKIYVVDFRYFDINAIDFINEVGATDLLFAVSLSSAHTESHINAIGNLRIQQPAEEELPDVQIPEQVIPGEESLPEEVTPDGGENGNGEVM